MNRFNLPPGVSTNDLPGNRRREQERCVVCEELIHLNPVYFNGDPYHWVCVPDREEVSEDGD